MPPVGHRVRPRAARAAVLLAASVAALTGCADRRLVITSDPPGARVWVNDVDVGRTPTQAEFTYFGVYDVRVQKEGFETIITSVKAEQPLYEYPPFDLAAEAVGARTRVEWHFALQPVPETTQPAAEFEQGVLERGRELRTQLQGEPQGDPQGQPAQPAPTQPAPTQPR